MLNKKELLILDHLESMNKYRSDRILTLSVFQQYFLNFLDGDKKFTDNLLELLDYWHEMKYERRIKVSIEFLSKDLK